jgi:ABC-type sugar transport system ATPase subunit
MLSVAVIPPDLDTLPVRQGTAVNEASQIEFHHVTKRFPGVVALEDVSLAIPKGEFHAIVGENGAGKSTLMKILSGVITEFDGELCIHNAPARFSGTRDAERAGISIIHQELNLVEELSIAANIFLGRERRTPLGLLDDRQMEDEAAALFEHFGCRLSPRQLVGTLRVGDRQLVEIAKALSLESEIVVMDEPTSALTETEADRLFQVIERLMEQNVTVLYISHKMNEVFRMSDRISVLRDGRLVATRQRTDTNPREVTHLMVGREMEAFETTGRRQADDRLLEVHNLSLPWPSHARQWRLKDVSFSLRRGELLGIAGLMGAGRTELLECLFGSGTPEPHGRIILDGSEVRFRHPAEAMRAGVALVTEDRNRLGLFEQMNVRENITLCTLESAVAFGLVQSRTERAMAADSIASLGVKTSGVDAPVSTLSGGNQQKCIIARWLRTRPKLLLLDDPTRGIDVGAKAELYQVIDRLRRDGLGMIVTSSELPELITLCDRIVVLCEGRLTGEFARGEFSEQALMEAATRHF